MIGPAADTLRALPADPPIDFAFIDADKPGYRTYYDEIVERLRPGGLVLVDNVLWSGNVVDDDDQSRGHRWPSAPSTTTSPPTTASRW